MFKRPGKVIENLTWFYPVFCIGIDSDNAKGKNFQGFIGQFEDYIATL
jgi:hypothetical protein